MASIFNTLNIGYSGLTAAQAGVSTASHNITNAESEGYTRQRVVTAAATPIFSKPGNVGNGATITDITRIFDNFVYDRYTALSADKEYSDYMENILGELSTYFPEINEVGIKSDLKEYYTMWQSFSDNPDNNAIKLALAKQAEILSQSLANTQSRIVDLQATVNNQLLVNVNEVNVLAKELANINVSIELAEAGGGYTANDLRDKRNLIEKNLAKLIGSESYTGQISSDIGINSSSNISNGSYTISVAGFNIVDGSSYHPIHISNDKNENGFYELSYERQDGVLISMDENIRDGRIGAILELRGSTIDNNTGVPSDGTLQNVITQMNVFSSTLIESTNNLYAAGSTTRMESNILSLQGVDPILSSSLNVKDGAFDVVIYDIDGKVTARRTIDINSGTTMTGGSGSNSIQGQLTISNDDNSDGNATNDIDDYLQFNWATYTSGGNGLELVMNSSSSSKGYRFAIEDNLKTDSFNSGSNFAGALGLSRFFDGDNAQNMNLNFQLRDDPTNITAGTAPITGDNTLSFNMIQQQFELYDFNVANVKYESTIYGMFDVISTNVGISTNQAILNNQTVTAQFNATELEYSSVSKVSIDEELTNLIRYQTAYGAASKIITTIDQMMETLLGIKQ